MIERSSLSVVFFALHTHTPAINPGLGSYTYTSCRAISIDFPYHNITCIYTTFTPQTLHHNGTARKSITGIPAPERTGTHLPTKHSPP
jgi:hypothetical protein